MTAFATKSRKKGTGRRRPLNRQKQLAWLGATALLMCWGLGRSARAQSPAPLVLDLTSATETSQWTPWNGINGLQTTASGMQVDLTSNDPYMGRTPLNLTAYGRLWMTVRLYSEKGGRLQAFFAPSGAPHTETDSSGASVAPGVWQDVRLTLPAQSGTQTVLRLDPPSENGVGSTVIQKITFASRPYNALPTSWPANVQPNFGTNAYTLASGPLTFRHDRRAAGSFSVSVNGTPMGVGLTRSLIGYTNSSGVKRWQAFGTPTGGTNSFSSSIASVNGVPQLTENYLFNDIDGARWTLKRVYRPAASGAIEVTVSVKVNQNRNVHFFPLLVVLPGAGSGSFGSVKNQAVFPGLEYLGPQDASSSQADIETLESERHIPDNLKITFPMMAVQNGNAFLSLLWQKNANLSAFFDSPDRTFNAGGHAMGILFPGSDNINHENGDFLVHSGTTLVANTTYTFNATISGNVGNSVAHPISDYIARVPRPAISAGRDLQSFVSLVGQGWLDSDLRGTGADINKFRHAVWPGFNPQRTTDAATFGEWLALKTTDGVLAGRLAQMRTDVVYDYYNSSVEAMESEPIGHISVPVASLLYGYCANNVQNAFNQANNLNASFAADGSYHYVPVAGQLDYSRNNTPYRAGVQQDESNGWTARQLDALLERAQISGDASLIQSALVKLTALNKFDDDVPRGAQAWELPLHTPDILASAYLVSAYTRGYELSGDVGHLARARYWAWTGIPFIYLQNPTSGDTGPYATIATFGASGWVTSWMGKPVQWNGLVYANALRRLAKYDGQGPWIEMADGITASGVRQTWPETDSARRGLLPDFYHLRPQESDGPAINPATLMANAIPFYTGQKFYDFQGFPDAQMWVRAPGTITAGASSTNSATFSVNGWRDGVGNDYNVAISGLPKNAATPPLVTINGIAAPLNAGDGRFVYYPADGLIVLQVNGDPTITITK